MTAQESFHLFSSLPAEIRLQIWQYGCHQRVVEVSYNAEKDLCTTTTSPPAVLHTCHQSREEALRFYKKLFGTKTHPAEIFFHPELDTLYIPRPADMGYDDSSRDFATLTTGAPEVLNLALDHVNPMIRRPWETYNKHTLMRSFSQVTEVYLVLDSELELESEIQETKPGFLGLTEPSGDRTSMCKLLADVKESFSFEVGPVFGVDEKEDGIPQSPALVLKSKVASSYLRLL
jgi:hypothetical protein